MIDTGVLRNALGRPVSELGSGYPIPEHGIDSQSEIMTTGDPNFTIGQWNAVYNGGTTGASGAWYGANLPAAYPFVLNQPRTVFQLGWMNGSAAGDNWDVGIYDTSWNRLISTGSTVGSGASTFQFVDVTDTVLGPGRYYIAAVVSTTTANRANFLVATTQPGQPVNAALGVMDSGTTALPLPNPLTNMVAAATVTNCPILLIALRSLV